MGKNHLIRGNLTGGKGERDRGGGHLTYLDANQIGHLGGLGGFRHAPAIGQ